MTFPFYRFSGVDYLFDKCKDHTILDVGCGDGLIALELIRNGALSVHGVDNKREDILFCNRLYRNIHIESYFCNMDLCMNYAIPALNKFPFKKTYDIILFMSVYEKIEHRMGNEYVTQKLMPAIESKCSKYLVVRTVSTHASFYRPIGFNMVHSTNNQVGNTFVYEKNED